MKIHALAFAALLLTAQAGCTSLPAVTRGQSPSASDPSVQTASHHHGQAPFSDRSTYNAVNPHEAIHDHFHGQQISYYPDPNGGYAPGCPPGYGSHPIGYHDAYTMGPCGPACGPRHHMTFSYSRPCDLRYPDQQTTGGAVVYPYYTLKGPSCFFRDDDRREYR